MKKKVHLSLVLLLLDEKETWYVLKFVPLTEETQLFSPLSDQIRKKKSHREECLVQKSQILVSILKVSEAKKSNEVLAKVGILRIKEKKLTQVL